MIDHLRHRPYHLIMNEFDYSKIVIVGSSSSGKTTLGRQLSKILGQPHQELDFFNWEENWTEAKHEVFRQRVDEFTSKTKWITDGNYGRVQDLTINRATLVIWLDYSLPLILSRFFRRSIRRSITKEELWNGNRETLKNSMWGKESLLAWILQVYPKNIARYEEMITNNDSSKRRFLRFKTPRETKDFVQKLEKLSKLS
ncbi:MAG: adenylate kinase [Deltaproteobacteria bacterium]|nr:MAG: adenylate kinase [Deltaproteobacteria bacterium]